MKKIVLLATMLAAVPVQTFCSEPKSEQSLIEKTISKVVSVSKNIIKSVWFGAITAGLATTSVMCYNTAIEGQFKVENLNKIVQNPLMLFSPSYDAAQKELAFLQPLPVISFAGSAIAGVAALYTAFKTLESVQKVITLED